MGMTMLKNISVLASAEEYTKRGWYVFRVGYKSKFPFKGTHGFNDATRDKALIKSWFSENGKINIGIGTGEISGLVVVDIDVDEDKRKDGFKSIKVLGGLPDTYTVKTINGKQYYYKYPENCYKIGCKQNLGKYGGIDIRGDSGYVVAPPSLHPSGIFYEVEKNLPLADFPESIMKLCLNNKSSTKKKQKKSKEKNKETPQNSEYFVLMPYSLLGGMARHKLSGPQISIYMHMRGKCGKADNFKYYTTTQFECPYDYFIKDLGYLDSTINNAIKKLIEKGFIEKVRQGGASNGNKWTSIYRLCNKWEK